MLNYSPNSFVGFFDVVAEVLDDLGDEWKKSNDKNGKRWGDIFIKSSDMIKNVVRMLSEVKDEYEAENTKPEDLIRQFKIDILKVI
jgi:hypothetical protein